MNSRLANMGLVTDGRAKRRQFLDRLTAIECRLARLTGYSPDFSELESRLSANRADLNAVGVRLTALNSEIGALNDRAEAADRELMEALRKTAEMAAARLGALAGGIEPAESVGVRVTNLENDVARQHAMLAELQQCSLHTERTMQKLLAGIERLISGNNSRGSR